LLNTVCGQPLCVPADAFDKHEVVRARPEPERLKRAPQRLTDLSTHLFLPGDRRVRLHTRQHQRRCKPPVERTVKVIKVAANHLMQK
jgi:hypothetical protein